MRAERAAIWRRRRRRLFYKAVGSAIGVGDGAEMVGI